VSHRDKDQPVVVFHEIPDVLCGHISKDQQKKIDATDNGHDTESIER
jgi:hypothetical protein